MFANVPHKHVIIKQTRISTAVMHTSYIRPRPDYQFFNTSRHNATEEMNAYPLDANRAIQAIVNQAIGTYLDDLNLINVLIALNYIGTSYGANVMSYVIKIRIYDNTLTNCIHGTFTNIQANKQITMNQPHSCRCSFFLNCGMF